MASTNVCWKNSEFIGMERPKLARSKSRPPSLALPADWIGGHRAHDYAWLMRRWRALARAANMRLDIFAHGGDHEVFCIRSRSLEPAGSIYISAGIHGDEPAGTEALITWAGQNIELLRHRPFILLPCLNPWGLINNSRLDDKGRDLNRAFHHDKIEMVRNLKRLIRPYRFSLSMTLHEDYDAQGLYIYEIQSVRPYWGEALLEAARPVIAIEGRSKIEGRAARAGLVRRKIDLKEIPLLPEAVYLSENHSGRSFTFETPSEFALDQRVRAHMTLIDFCVKRTFPLG